MGLAVASDLGFTTGFLEMYLIQGGPYTKDPISGSRILRNSQKGS